MIDLILILNDHEKLGKQSKWEDQNETERKAESMFGHFYDCKIIKMRIQRNITVNKHAQRDMKEKKLS